ncbi:MAG: LytTR family DNA-binding domain-containing protein [Gammaproteobacteria bacterium]|jgi:two-component system response regulator AlgR|nr:LytTR family DNA-binding domain-containing protein [Gammaproteobacteria bacterium]
MNNNDKQHPMRVLIVDDEPLARQRLQRQLDTLPEVDAVAQAADAASAWQLIVAMRPDALLLDINMPGEDGMQLAEKLQQLPAALRPAIIFTTAHEQHAVAAFALQAVDYLLKPIQQQRLLEVLQRLAQSHRSKQDSSPTIAVRLGREEHWLSIESIACCIASDKYTCIHHDRGEHVSHKSLRELEQLHDDYFLRVHRNALVAKSRIIGIHHADGNKLLVKLRDCQQRPEISRRYRQSLQELLHGLSSPPIS